MNRLLVHRGPDDEGVFTSGSVALGHRRLSILDLSASGHQPMKSREGRFTLVFNGEIFNYIELREELASHGAEFRTTTDTEVLLAAYERWGPECVQRLNGMWAFAIHDAAEATLFLSRDRLGIKPLHYIDRSDVFAFASEPKAIVGVFPEERRPNEALIGRFIESGQIWDDERTVFEGVRTLGAGCNAWIRSREGSLRIERFWNIPEASEEDQLAPEAAVEALWPLLNSAIELHMRSDVPVGTCLSGGLDSSSVVGLMSKRGVDVHTYSGLYALGEDYDESQWVDAVNRHVGAKAHPVSPRPGAELLEDLTRITWHQDAPSAGPGLYTQYKVMQTAAEDVTVILDGQGGDELFAGYIPYFVPHLRDLVNRGPLAWPGAVGCALGVSRFWGPRHLSGLLPGTLHRLLRVLMRMRGLAKPVTSVLDPAFPREADAPAVCDRADSRLGTALYRDVTATCLPALLQYEDRNSMAYSLEARVPLLDYRIVELAFRMSSAAKIHGTWTKWALRRCAERVVPDSVAWRRSKLGYPTPFAIWIRDPSIGNPILELIESPTAISRKIVRPDVVRGHWDQHQSGHADHSWLLWRLVTLELWYRSFIDQWSPAPARPIP